MDDVAADFSIDIWPDNIDAIFVFCDLMTQWRVSDNRAYGLDYSVMDFVFKMHEIEDKASMFRKIRIMENAAVNEMRSN